MSKYGLNTHIGRIILAYSINDFELFWHILYEVTASIITDHWLLGYEVLLEYLYHKVIQGMVNFTSLVRVESSRVL